MIIAVPVGFIVIALAEAHRHRPLRVGSRESIADGGYAQLLHSADHVASNQSVYNFGTGWTLGGAMEGTAYWTDVTLGPIQRV